MNQEKEILDIKKRLKTMESWQSDLDRRLERYEDLVGRMEIRLDRAAKMAAKQLEKME